ncbi:MAG: efflux RND transporter periplasmic adaptor subunit [Gemmatimonadaceae bacterium]|nr:efflux RND transporter periplasmic adaptor subunit [Gemmatimonadaceae bacterium]
MRRSTRLSWMLAPALMACGGGSSTPADAPPTAVHPDTATLSADAVAIAGFTIDTVRTLPWRNTVMSPARLLLDPSGVETIGSITEGRISHVLVRVGDAVKAGDVLVMIHSHEIMDARGALASARAQVTAADAARSVAISAADRAHRLLEAKAMSRAEVERADAARVSADAMQQQAVAERERAEALVEHLVGGGPVPPNADPHDVLIRTPIAGIVITRDAQPGTVVLPGSPLVTVGNPERLILQLRLGETAAQGVRVGATVQYTLTDDPLQHHDAVVTRVAPTVDTLTRTIEVLATPRGRVRIGRAESFAQAEVIGSGGTPAVVVPAAALQAMEGDTIVIATEPRGAGMFIEAVPVRVGRRTGDRVELLSGVGVGRPVLVGSAAIAKAELLKRRTGGVE